MALRNAKAVDMTNGNLFWKMILFALPVVATTVMQLLYVTIDLTTVHYGDSAESMGAIASNNALINLVIVVFTGVSLGVNVILSEARGANDKERASKVIHSSILFALFSGIIVGVIGFFICDDLLRLMGTESHYFEKAATYLRIYFCGLPFLMLYNYEAQMLRAQGDSRTPFLVLVFSGIVNVGFDCLFVFPMHMGVSGVALATILSEGVSALLCWIALMKGKRIFVPLEFKKLRIDRAVLWDVLRVGLPSGLQGFFFSLPNVFIQASLYTIDPGNVNLENGATAAANIEGYFFAIIDGIGAATMTFVAANMGAKKANNIRNCMLFGLSWGLIGCVFVLLVTLLLYRPLLSLFVDNEESIQAGYQRLFVMGTFYGFNAVMNISGACLRGIKKSLVPMITTMICCTGLRILLILTAFQLEQFHTITWLYALFPITWVLTSVCNGVAMFILIPKTMRKLAQPQEGGEVVPTQIIEG